MAEPPPVIRGLLQRAIRAGAAPAAVAEWGRADSKRFRAAFGASSLFPEPVAVSASSWFDLASLTKPLVTTTLAVLAFRSGSLDRATRVGEVLRETGRSAVGDLVVDNLLTHTAGLPAWLPLYCVADGDADSLPSHLPEIGLQAPPGEKVIYSCIGFVILGLMLGRIANLRLDELFEREVLAPLGLKNELGFRVDPATQSLLGGSNAPVVETRLVNELGFDTHLIPPVAPGLPDDGNARFLAGVAGNAGLFGTVRGVAALASEYLPAGGELLSNTEAAEAIRPRTQGLEQIRGWGWQLGSTPRCSAGESLSGSSFGHTGFTGVSVWCDPVKNGVFVLLTNRNHPSQRENDLHPLRRRFHDLATRSFER